MRHSIRDDDRFAEAVEAADKLFRKGFAELAKSALDGANTIDLDERVKLKMREKPRTGPPGNPGAVRDFVAASGWIQTPYMEALFEVLCIPNAPLFSMAYDALHKAIDGRSESWYRERRSASMPKSSAPSR